MGNNADLPHQELCSAEHPIDASVVPQDTKRGAGNTVAARPRSKRTKKVKLVVPPAHEGEQHVAPLVHEGDIGMVTILQRSTTVQHTREL